MKGSSLPLVEQWDEFVMASHSKYAVIEDEDFLLGTRVMATLNKLGCYCLKKEFRREVRQFLKEFRNSVLSTVAARSIIEQRLNSFCPAIFIDENNYAPLQLFGSPLDTFVEKC